MEFIVSVSIVILFLLCAFFLIRKEWKKTKIIDNLVEKKTYIECECLKNVNINNNVIKNCIIPCKLKK